MRRVVIKVIIRERARLLWRTIDEEQAESPQKASDPNTRTAIRIESICTEYEIVIAFISIRHQLLAVETKQIKKTETDNDDDGEMIMPMKQQLPPQSLELPRQILGLYKRWLHEITTVPLFSLILVGNACYRGPPAHLNISKIPFSIQETSRILTVP